MSTRATQINRFLNRMLSRAAAALQRPGSDPEIFRIWERNGLHLTPVHFYQPIPDTREISRRYCDQPRNCHIDFFRQEQLNFLMQVTKYQEEYNAFEIQRSSAKRFYLDNDAFTGIDPHVYHCMIRHYQPRRIIEIGSGHSTILAAEALELGPPGYSFTAIDPYARHFVREYFDLPRPGCQLVTKPAEEMDLGLFGALEANDILFIDSSHVARFMSDVVYMVLEVLPQLRPGVLVHFHDIYLPYDYPLNRLIENHQFWNEQYLLEAYLGGGGRGKVVFANHLMVRQYPEEIKRAFPRALGWWGGSFWFRTK